jgi:RNA polymerase primary sigma factor
MTGIENKTFSNVKYTSRKRSLKHMSTIATMIMTWSVTYYGSGVTAFGNHSSQSTTNTAKTITQRMVQLKNELRLTTVQRHMSSVADPQTRTIKRSSSDHQAVITMTRSQVDSFITRRDMERLEASFGMDSDDILQLSETLKILPPTLNTSTKTTTRTGKIKTTVSESKSLLQDVETMIDSHSSSSSSSTNNNNNKQSSSRRLSTMPGFRTRQHTKRHQSFRDGLKIAQTSNIYNARKIAKAVNDKSTQRKRKKSNSEAMYLSSASVPDSMIAFTNEIHQESRITPKEEADLGTKTQIAMKLQKIHSELTDRLGREPTDDEWCAATGKINITVLQQAIQEGMEAKDRLVLSNLRMVQGVVNLYIRNGLGSQYNAGDLMQEGTMALIRAAEKFEPDRGFRFSTYAMYWIRAAVKRSQILQSRVIEVPQRLHETHKKVLRIETELKKELGREPSQSELASSVGITEKQLKRCLDAIDQQCFSLDAEIQNTLNPNKSGTKKDTMYDILTATYDNVELKQIENDFMKQALIETIRRYLAPMEVNLLLLRYGLMDERTLPYGFSGPLTIAEISRLVELKPDKVRRMINKSLRHLRDLIAHEWEDY